MDVARQLFAKNGIANDNERHKVASGKGRRTLYTQPQGGGVFGCY